MTRYLISFDAHAAMDHIPDEDMPAVAKAAHEVVQEAMDAGVWVFGGSRPGTAWKRAVSSSRPHSSVSRGAS